MDTLLLELRNIKLALINSSADLSIIFKSPLDHLKTDVNIYLFIFINKNHSNNDLIL